MRRIYSFGLLLFFSLFSLKVTSQEAYLTFDEVSFYSDLEKNTLKDILAGNSHFLDGFLVFAHEDSLSFEKWKSFYYQEVDILKKRKIPKKLEKDIKTIYDRLHEKFLRKYSVMAFFDEIFESGVYNCVTAVALYALAFEELGIPYVIKETPTHVYMVVDPDNAQLLIETTDPIGGFKSFSPGFKERFVTQLAMMKMVDQGEISSKGMYPIFDEFYFGGSDLSVRQLIGIQYYNQGVDLFSKKDYVGSWNALSKAQLFHQSDQINSLLFSALVSVLSGSDYSSWYDISLLPFLTRFETFDVKDKEVVGEFVRMLEYVLIERNDDQLAEKAFEEFVSNSDNITVNEEVTYVYYFELARKYYQRANYLPAFEAIAHAYQVKPGNVNAETLLSESFRLAYRNKPVMEAIASLDTLMNTNNVLKGNNHFQTMRLNLYLSQMAKDFDLGNVTSGKKMKNLFEKALEDNKSLIFDSYILSNAYSSAAVYYFKRGYTSTARLVIRKGLEYVPESYELKSRLRMIGR